MPWGAFTGGHPFDRLDPHQITGDYFFFNPPGFGLDGGVADATVNADAPADFDAASSDAAATDAGPDGAASDAGADPDAARAGYTADIFVDDVQLVAY